jgi:hypothetical protein
MRYQLILAMAVMTAARLSALAAEGDSLLQRVDVLVGDGQYEAARRLLEGELPKPADRSTVYLKLSHVHLLRRDLVDAFSCFSESLKALPSPTTAPAPDVDLERRLDVVAFFRTREAYPAASSLLSACRTKWPQAPSLLYEQASLDASQDRLADFFTHYHAAWRFDPANPRGLPGKAAIATVMQINRRPAAPDDFPWLPVTRVYLTTPTCGYSCWSRWNVRDGWRMKPTWHA